MLITQKCLDELTYQIIGCAIEVHKQLGPGLIECVYAKCYNRELSLRHISFQNQLWVPIEYKGMSLESDLRLDVLINDLILVELKSVEGMYQFMKPRCSLI